MDALSVDELSNVLSFIAPKELFKCCIGVNKLFKNAVFHGNTWNDTRLSSRQLFRCKNDNIFMNWVRKSWSNLSKFSFMNYKSALTRNQKQILTSRIICILNSSHNSLSSVQLHGVDLSLFRDEQIKPLHNLRVLWIVAPKRDYCIAQNIWRNFSCSTSLQTLEFMSTFPLALLEVTELRLAMQSNQSVVRNLKNLKLSVDSSLECNQEVCKLIELLSPSLQIVFVTGMKYISNAQCGISDALCKCQHLMVLSLMYRNRYDPEDLYSHSDCYDLLYDVTLSLSELKVLSLEYGPLVDYEWQEAYKEHIAEYGKSLIWVKIGQNRIKNPFLSTYISPNIKCNRFCLSWNANI